MAEQVWPEEFAKLPREVRDRILREGDALGEHVVQHCAQILIGPPASDAGQSHVNHASGITITRQSKGFLATAWHVVAEYLERRKGGDRVLFQVGNATVPAHERVTWRDIDIDATLLALTPIELARVPARTWTADTWPPPVLTDEDYIAFAGYPAEFRMDAGPAAITLNAIGGLLRVASASERRLTSVLERDNLVLTRGPVMPSPTAKIGGMSGGPVFRVTGGRFDLVGIISDYGPSLDAFLFGALASSILDHDARVAV